MTTRAARVTAQGPGRLSSKEIISFFWSAAIPLVVMALGTYATTPGVVKGRPPGTSFRSAMGGGHLCFPAVAPNSGER